jgi:hypothetical protein
MKRAVFSYLVVVVLTVLTALTSCSDTSTMKGTTYINSNAENKPMFFATETVGVLEFVGDNKVDILFPYAIDKENIKSTIRVSSELWVPGEYKRTGNTITIHLKLNKDQEKPVVLEVQVKDDGKTLLGGHGARFNKIDK